MTARQATRCIIAGSRSATPRDVGRALLACGFTDEIEVVLSGCVVGADRHGARWAHNAKLTVEYYPADWARLGKRAGFDRNIAMAQAADALLAVWDGESRGTAHMISEARVRGLTVFVHRFEPQGVHKQLQLLDEESPPHE